MLHTKVLQSTFGGTMSSDYVPIEEAAQLSGLHLNTLRRLLRVGVVRGYKLNHGGRQRWMVSVRSLQHYTDPITGFLLDLPGPKLYLRKRDEGE
jgi:hypothetical protein